MELLKVPQGSGLRKQTLKPEPQKPAHQQFPNP